MTTRYDTAQATATTSNATLYTVPSDAESAIIIFGVAHNVGTDTTLNVNVVPSGGSVGSTNEYMEKTIATASPDPMDSITGMVLETGDFISIVGGVNDRINVRISVLEILDD
jgi:hypothetical protein